MSLVRKHSWTGRTMMIQQNRLEKDLKKSSFWSLIESFNSRRAKELLWNLAHSSSSTSEKQKRMTETENNFRSSSNYSISGDIQWFTAKFAETFSLKTQKNNFLPLFKVQLKWWKLRKWYSWFLNKRKLFMPFGAVFIFIIK